MDYAAKLESPSVREQSFAVLFLRSEGINGAKHLPALLERCTAIDSSKELDRFEEALLGFGALTLGDIVGQIGFDPADSLHAAILNFILRGTSWESTRVAGYSIHALAQVRPIQEVAIECICEIVESPLRNDEHEHLSLRAFALRTLRRLDADHAAEFVDTPAFQEYAHAIEGWMSQGASSVPETQAELESESTWLTGINDRRTKR